jgi:uncharacterized protein YggE
MVIRRTLMIGAAVVSLAAVAGVPRIASATVPPSSEPPAPPQSAGSGEGTITVAATGTVRVDPDTAVVTLGVQANAPTGAEAMEQVNSSSAALTEALIGAGIAEEDIQTSGLNLWTTTDDRGEINGYQASLSVSVTIRDIEAVGATIDAAQEATGPGFTIGGVSFSFAEPETVLEDARVEAVELARTKAEQYAAAAGLTLGDVVAIVEAGSTPPIPVDARFEVTAQDAAAAGPAISPGQLDLTVDVSVTFSTTS